MATSAIPFNGDKYLSAVVFIADSGLIHALVLF
jgi:hypothetical protein